MDEHNTELLIKVIGKFNELKDKSQDIRYLLSSLQQISDNHIGIFGGAARDWWLDKTPKDVDLVVYVSTEKLHELLKNFSSKKNAFDGNVITIDDVIFDIWALEDTYAFKTKQYEQCWYNLVQSVPFNTDAVVVVTNGVVHASNFWNCLTSSRIEFVNRTIRDPEMIADRAVAFSLKYGFELSDELKQYVKIHSSKNNLFGKIKERKSSSNKLYEKFLKEEDFSLSFAESFSSSHNKNSSNSW
jgi:hypothetical protein